MFTKPTEGEGNLGQWRVNMLITIVKPTYYCYGKINSKDEVMNIKSVY